MNYVEWLRVRNVVRIFSVVLGVVLVLGLIARIWVGFEFRGDRSIVDRLQTDPGTITAHAVVGGRPETILVNPHSATRVTIEDRPDGGRVVTVVEPKSNRPDDSVTHVGSFSITETTGATMRTTVINTNSAVSFAIFLSIGYLAALIIATVLGASFARENNGHLEFAMLKPVTRERFALGVIAADIVGIFACEALTILAALAGQAMYEIPHLNFSGLSPAFVGAVAIVPLAWYAFLNAASASLKRGSGSIIGFSWPVSVVVVMLATIHLEGSALGQVVHEAFWVISRIDPLTYASVVFHDRITPGGQGVGVIVSAILFIVYGALAILQWRRVEA
jgi:hypothetical protein